MSAALGRAARRRVEGPRLVEALRDRLRPAVLARQVLLPPLLAGAAVTCLLAALALTIGSRAGTPNPLARTPAGSEPLAIGLSTELGVTAGSGSIAGSPPAPADRDDAGPVRLPAAPDRPAPLEARAARLASLAAAAPEPAGLAAPVAGTTGGCGTFGCPRPGHLHNGVDFMAPAGTPVRAAASGRVALVQSPARSAGYGNFVCIQHRPALATCYAHLDAVAARVRLGATVRRGQLVGLVGATGSASSPHLHFEVRRGPAGCQECAVDPLALLPRSAGGRPEARITSDAAKPAAAPVPFPAPRPVAPAAPKPGGASSTPDAATTLVQNQPARPQRIPLPPQPKPEPAPQPKPEPAPQSDAPAPAPATSPSNPATATDLPVPPEQVAPPVPGGQ